MKGLHSDRLVWLRWLTKPRKFDWSLEIISDDALPAVPRAYQHLVNKSLSGDSTEVVDKFGFVYPGGIVLPTILGIAVEDVHMRSTSQFRIHGTPYIVEIAIDRKMSQTRSLDSNGHCEITLYCAEWDLPLGPNGELSSRMEELFPPGKGSKDGVERFLAAVRSVQDLLDNVPE